MSRLRQLLLGGSLFGYPLLVHAFVVREAPVAALQLLVGMSLALTLTHFVLRPRPGGRLWAYLYGLLSILGAVSLLLGHVFALYLPQVIFNLSLAFFFGLTLRPGAIPLIERFMRLQFGVALPGVMVVYARRLTLVWTIFFVAMALIGIGLAGFASLEAWSTFANIVNYLLVAALFAGQFIYGYLRYRVQTKRETLETVLGFLRHGAGGAGEALQPAAGGEK